MFSLFLIPLHHLFSLQVTSEQLGILRKHHGVRGGMSLTHLQSLASHSLTEPWHFIWSLVRGLFPVCISWRSPARIHLLIPAADAHSGHHDSWPSTAHLASSCSDIRPPWFPFLAWEFLHLPTPHIDCREPALGGALSQALYKPNTHNTISNLLETLHAIVGKELQSSKIHRH